MPRWKVSLHNKQREESEKDWDLYFVSFYFSYWTHVMWNQRRRSYLLCACCCHLAFLIVPRSRRSGHSLPNLATPHTGRGEGVGWKWQWQHLATALSLATCCQTWPYLKLEKEKVDDNHSINLLLTKNHPHPPLFMRPPKSTSGYTLSNMVTPHSQYHAEINDVRIISIFFIVIPVTIFPPPLVCASHRLSAITSQSCILYFEAKN